MAPAGMPSAISQKLNREINKALENPELRNKLMAMGYQIHNSTPEQVTQKIKGGY